MTCIKLLKPTLGLSRKEIGTIHAATFAATVLSLEWAESTISQPNKAQKFTAGDDLFLNPRELCNIRGVS